MNIPKIILHLAFCLPLIACGEDLTEQPDAPGNGGTTVDRSSTTGIDRFGKENIFSRNVILPLNTAMQGFHFDSDGSIWYIQVGTGKNKHLIYWTKGPNADAGTAVKEEKNACMKLAYFGHGTNTALEELGDERYLWAGTFGVCNTSGQYWNEKLVGRVKWVEGATVKADACDEYFYIGRYTDLHPSIDAQNDLLTINYSDPAQPAYRCFAIYRLSEAKEAPVRNIMIGCTDGFESDDPASIRPTNVWVSCRDLTSLTPVARPKFLKNGFGAEGDRYYDWQGYEVHKDRLYYADGQSNYSISGDAKSYDGLSHSYVTVFDFSGNVVEERTQVAIVSDREKLEAMGISCLGYLEAEGLQVHDGKLYLGYTVRGVEMDNPDNKLFHQDIFRFGAAAE